MQRADEDLEDELKEEGYAEPKDTVSEINSLEEEIADHSSFPDYCSCHCILKPQMEIGMPHRRMSLI